MASVKPYKGRWRVQVAIQGKRSSKIVATKREGLIWGLEQEKLLKDGTAIAEGYTIKNAYDRYAKEVSPTKRGERWEVIRLKKLSKDQLAGVRLDKLQDSDIQSWIDRQTISDGSILRELNLIQSVLKSACQWRWSLYEPKNLVKPKSPKNRDRLISTQEQYKLTQNLTEQTVQKARKTEKIVIQVFQLALETAMRKGELLSLTWDNVYLDKKYVHLPITKNGKSRDVPLSSKAVEILKSIEPINEKVFDIKPDTFDQLFRKLKVAAGVSGFTFHDTRHTAITNLVSKLSVIELARMVGHSNINQLLTYYNASAEQLASKLD